MQFHNLFILKLHILYHFRIIQFKKKYKKITILFKIYNIYNIKFIIYIYNIYTAYFIFNK